MPKNNYDAQKLNSFKKANKQVQAVRLEKQSTINSLENEIKLINQAAEDDVNTIWYWHRLRVKVIDDKIKADKQAARAILNKQKKIKSKEEKRAEKIKKRADEKVMKEKALATVPTEWSDQMSEEYFKKHGHY